MTNFQLTLNSLQEKLDDLQRDTKFCVNSYDYHHKNNERQILENLQDILKDSLREGNDFIASMETMRSSIDAARKKCIEIDELLDQLGYKTEAGDNAECCFKGSQSFCEEQVNSTNIIKPLKENKENAN